MVSAADALFLVGILVALVLYGLGLYTYRRYDELGVSAFSGFLGVLGCGALGSGLAGLFPASFVQTPSSTLPLWALFAFLFWGFSAVPWLVFTLRYTGRSTRIRWRTIGLLYVPFLGFGANVAIGLLDLEWAVVVQSLVGTTVLFYALVLTLVGVSILMWTTRQYSHLSLTASGLLAAGPLGLFLAGNSLNFTATYVAFGAGVFVSGYGFVALVSALAVFRYDTFESTPAVGTLGEQEIVREIDDLVFLVDDSDRVIKCNEAVAETLGTTQTELLGEPLDEVLAHTSETLRTRETVTLETADGKRRYDTQLSTITDQHDRKHGVLVTLHDVTDRELREQRLSVLNRVLRHNLRNKTDVIKSHAEFLVTDRPGQGEDYSETIVRTADEIANLGDRARIIDGFVSESTQDQRTDISAVVRATLEALDTDDRITISLDIPTAAPVTTNQAALAGALESALENAVTYADSRVSIAVETRPQSYRITIVDDGPGIPDSEIAAIEAGTETALQHGTGLGLWQLRWAVRTMDGSLSFDTTDGTTVEITVPAPDENRPEPTGTDSNG